MFMFELTDSVHVLLSFPTRRSSDLGGGAPRRAPRRPPARTVSARPRPWVTGDRKSTRLNSSHLGSSYAVFCLKKKKKRLHILLCMTSVEDLFSVDESHASRASTVAA